MAYTDRKTTGLKWFRFTQVILMPVSIVLSAYFLLSIVFELFQFNASGLFKFFKLFGLNVTSLGEYTLPSLGLIVASFAMLCLSAAAWFGSFVWRKYSVVSRIFWLLLALVVTVGGIYLYMHMGLHTVLAKKLGMNELLVKILFAGAAALLTAYFLLSLLYWFKRRKLFRTAEQIVLDKMERKNRKYGYSEPEPVKETKKEEVKPEPVKEEKKEDIQLTLEPEVIEPEVEEPSPIRTIFRPITADPDRKKKDPEVTESEEVKAEDLPDMKFCMYCGAKVNLADSLYCSNCGKKLA